MFKMQKIMTHIKQKNFLWLAALAIVVAATLALCACDKDGKRQAMSPIYDLNMQYDPAAHLISARQEVLFELPEDADCAVFHINANAFSDDNDVIDISAVKIDRKTVDFEIYGKNKTLLKIPCETSGIVDVCFEFCVRLPFENARLGYGENCAALNCFYPSLAVFDGEWRDDAYENIGDPFFCECSDFYVTLTLDSDLEVAASGEIVCSLPFEKDGKSLKTVEICAEKIRDLGIVVGNFFSVSQTLSIEGEDVDVSYFYLSDEAPLETLERAASAIETFSQTFGPYPYPSFCFAEVPLDGAGGMEYGAFATISPSSREYFLDAVTHEIAHQWWYGAVGNDQNNSAWMDEGLSEFCTYFYYRVTGDDESFSRAIRDIFLSYNDFLSVMRPVGFNAEMQRPLNSYLSNGEYVAVNYQKGALLFDHLYNLVGEKKFVAALGEYFRANKFAVATPSSLAAAFKTQGFDVSAIITSWINNKDK